MTFYITTLGCKVNQYESEYMRELLLENGYIESNSSDADINIINSCTVTSIADSKNRKVVNRIRREHPSTIIVFTGCMPQTTSFDDDSIYDKCDIVLGNTTRKNLPDVIHKYVDDKIKNIDIKQHQNGESFENTIISSFEERTRAYIKVEDGCNQFCTYCTIPYARGRVRSKELAYIEKEAAVLANNGYKEIVLVGINLSCYGMDLDNTPNIYDAIHTVCEIDGVERVRLGSFEPERLTEDIIESLSKETKFCPSFHLSLQSGCDETLKRMRRHYTTKEYKDIVNSIRKHFKNPTITTDLMIGFSGETQEEFNNTISFIDDIMFSRIHIFPYSRRKGTLAYNYPNVIDNNVKKDRCKIAEEHANTSKNEFMKSQINTKCKVLFETVENNLYSGYSENYTLVKVDSDFDLKGEIREVIIKSFEDDYCIGELC